MTNVKTLERNDKLDTIRDDWKTRGIWKLETNEKARILRASISPEQQDELLVEGFYSYVCKNRPIVVAPSGSLLDTTAQRLERTQRRRVLYQVTRQKAKAFDRMIERLDHQYVGAKILGDCTRADLLRAANSTSTAENNLSLDRALYTELAALLRDGETVREARQRGEVRKLLEARYGAE